MTRYLISCRGHRVILLGLVGTLTQKRASGMSYDRFQRFANCGDSNRESLRILGSDPNTTVVVLTSRNRQMCKMVLGKSPVWVAAENGIFLRTQEQEKDDDWRLLADNLDLSWMDEVRRVFDYFAERTPRSFVEKEDTFLSWHYRDADRELGEQQARDLLMHLVTGPLVNTSAEVISSAKIVQVRPAGITKGNMGDRILGELQRTQGDLGFVMCIGNFLGRDEDVFQHLSNAKKNRKREPTQQSQPVAVNLELPESCYVATVNVGAIAGHAKTFVRNTNEVEALLRRLAGTVEHCRPSFETLAVVDKEKIDEVDELSEKVCIH